MYEVVKKYSFPRLVGSAGEKKARGMVIEDFNAIGLDPIIEEFRFSTYFANVVVRGSLGMVGVVLLLYILKDFFPSLIPVFIGMGIVFLCYCPYMIYVLKHPAKTKPQNRTSHNIHCRIPAKRKKSGIVVLSAHYDTKSQRISVWARCIYSLIVLLTGIIGFSIAVLFDILASTGNPVTNTSRWILRGFLMLAIVSAFILSLNKIENKSVGSVDNAAGMSIVFDLARWFKENPLQHYEIWVCQFGAEELGTMGSRFFLERHLDELRDVPAAYNLNFDMIDDRVQYLRARGMFPPKPMCKRLGVAFEQAAYELDIPWSKYSLIIGASSDQKIFFQHGIEAIDFQDRSGAKWAHSKYDTPDKVKPHLLRQSCEIAYGILNKIDTDQLGNRPPYWMRIKEILKRRVGNIREKRVEHKLQKATRRVKRKIEKKLTAVIAPSRLPD